MATITTPTRWPPSPAPTRRLVVNPAVFAMLSDDLKAKATAIGNGETTKVGEIGIEAVPAYNTTEERLKYHPKGRDNGYVLTIDGKRIYIAGDTEDIPEMRALKDIDVAFVPMNLPYTMTTEQAASAVAEFKPDYRLPLPLQGQRPAGLRRQGFRRHRGGDGPLVRRGLNPAKTPPPLRGGRAKRPARPLSDKPHRFSLA